MQPRADALAEECTVELAMAILGGKWKLVILRHLLTGTLRFGELHRAMPGITPRMLTRQLRELEVDGLVRRTVYPLVPPKVEYSVTELGESLRDIADRLEHWGHWYREQTDQDKSPSHGP
ncbi:MAG TPA: helix-turn-helix domain-containing protein [Pseudonocardia sp.]|jgi:DNA-binding HxlR family transcriptional regulator|uniref:winged helix-turn-helix transcriptional regulator n=1 Tax=Pseudonocardia sp. TaxID=60912 RepID=UPI002ED85743